MVILDLFDAGTGKRERVNEIPLVAEIKAASAPRLSVTEQIAMALRNYKENEHDEDDDDDFYIEDDPFYIPYEDDEDWRAGLPPKPVGDIDEQDVQDSTSVDVAEEVKPQDGA